MKNGKKKAQKPEGFGLDFAELGAPQDHMVIHRKFPHQRRKHPTMIKSTDFIEKTMENMSEVLGTMY